MQCESASVQPWQARTQSALPVVQLLGLALARMAYSARMQRAPDATSVCAMWFFSLPTWPTPQQRRRRSDSYPVLQRSAPRTYLPQRPSQVVWRRWTLGLRVLTEHEVALTAAPPCGGGRWPDSDLTSGRWRPLTGHWSGLPLAGSTRTPAAPWTLLRVQLHGDAASRTTACFCAVHGQASALHLCAGRCACAELALPLRMTRGSSPAKTRAT